MSNDILRAAHEEEQRLLQELEQSPVYRRLQLVRALIEEYGDQPFKPTVTMPPTSTTPSTPTGTPTKSEKIVAAAKSLLGKVPKGQPYLRTRRILSILEGQGLEVGGKEPIATLSAHLSNSGLFVSYRRYGWRLKPVEDDADSGKHRAPDEGNSSGAHVETGLATQ